jgi:hypothetical protein
MTAAAGSLATVGDLAGPSVETASSAVAAREKAAVEARYIMALKRPRDMDEVRVRLLKECERPGFAEVAKYEKPVGGQKIVGFSVRFAEAAIRLMTNVSVGILVVFDDERRRVLRVSVTDLEANVPYEQDVTIEKTVERRSSKDREVVGRRSNTTGGEVFIVLATEDEFANKQNAAISKALRNHGLRLIPGDILDECARKIDETARNRAARDPETEKKKVVDAFASIGISPKQLVAYLEHPLEQLVPAEIQSLRGIYQAIRDGETTWIAVTEEKFGEAAGGQAADRPRPQRVATKAEAGAETTANGEKPAAVSDEPAAPAAPEKGENGGGDEGRVIELETGSKIVHPPKTGALDPAKLTPLYRAQAAFDKAHGAGSAAKLLREKYELDKLSALSNAQADEYLEVLQDGAR